MHFDLRAFRRVIGFIALAGFLGNHFLVAIQALAAISQHNDVDVFKSDQWQPDYAEIFLDPTFSLKNADNWYPINHILFWSGVAAFLIWIVLKFSIRKQPPKQA